MLTTLKQKKRTMDAIQFFADNSITVVQITHIQQPSKESTAPPYAFAYRVSSPDYALPRTHHYRTTSLPRYYLNHKCLTTTWSQRKLGPLWTPHLLPGEPVRVRDMVLVDAHHSTKGYFSSSHLPPSWSTPIIEFFKLSNNITKTKYMLETSGTTDRLKNMLYIKCGETFITTLFHALVCLIAKDFTLVIDMLRYPRMRKTKYVTFEEVKASRDCQHYDVYVPTTIEFVVELALWAQEPQILQNFAYKLQKEIESNPTNFVQDARHWVSKRKHKHITYIRRILRHYSQT